MFLNPWYLQQQQQGVRKEGEGVEGSQDQAMVTSMASSLASSSPQSSEGSPAPGEATRMEEGGGSSHSPSPAPSLVSAGSCSSSCPPASPAMAAQLAALQAGLRQGWTAHITQEGRLYYCNHVTGTSGWLPPQTSWTGGGAGLPFGWEAATDKESRTYYVNHINKTSTYEDPRKWGSAEAEEVPEPREVELDRHPELGFGFVAGSEKPVIVRFVTGGGPSVDKLMPGDQIISINGEDVARAPRDHVIQLVRNCRETVSLLVCQPPLDNSSSRKSAILSASKKAKLKSNPSRVRFAESVDINGSPLFNPSNHSAMTSADSVIALMPNVLKVFLENGQTKSFKYDSSTTVQDVLDSLQAKLGLKAVSHFSLVVEHVKSLKRNKLTLLNPRDTLAKIASRPGAHNLRCLFRVTFVPKDAYELLRTDSVAFEYLFVQCCNDVVQERFAPELKYEIALRLAALHIHQHAVSNGLNSGNKVTIKAVEKETGLERFVPSSLFESMKKKELRKLLTHFLKLNQSLVTTGQKCLTGLQAKLHYLKIISELPSYGAKCFSTTLNSESNVETVILVSPKFGISQINSLRNTVPLNLCDIEGLSSIAVSKEDEVNRRVDIQVKDPSKENLVLVLEERDAEELVLVLCGYFTLTTDRDLGVTHVKTNTEETSPPYCGPHTVSSQGWNYPGQREAVEGEQYSVDLGAHPPYHQPPEGFKVPNSHLLVSGSDSGSDGDASMTSNTIMEANINIIDTNRNITNQEENANLTGSLRYSTFGPRYNTNNSNNNSGGSQSQSYPTGILKKSTPRQERKVQTVSTSEDDQAEARNEEVIRRVAEMKQILNTAEEYLDDDGEATDAESVVTQKSGTESEMSSNYGKLKHSDSLLLLTQEKEEGEGEQAAGNTEAVKEPTRAKSESAETAIKPKLANTGTPNNSPARGVTITTPTSQSRHTGLKHSDSSFGLHSPDSFNDDVQTLIRKFKADPQLKSNLADRKVALDADLTDLTMIPPPMTPDDEGPTRIFPGSVSAVSTPPTPFADRQSLEAELKALERDLGGLTKRSWDDGAVYGAVRFSGASGGAWDGEEDESSLNSLTLPDLVDSREPGGPSLAALRQLKSDDIDMFIANMAVPPPPSRLQQQMQAKHSPVVALTNDDLSAFIIPPPPPNAVNISRGGDREMLELRVTPNQMQAQDSQLSPRIASIQERLAQLSGDPKPGKEMSLTLQKDRYGYPSASSRGKEPISPTKQSEPSRLETAERSNVLRGQVQSKRDLFLRQASSPEMKGEEASPPPPPPRTALPRNYSSTLGRRPPSSTSSSSIPRSTSQEELRSSSTSSTSSINSSRPPVRAMASMINGKHSSSQEDLGLKRSPISPSKLSVTSSSDSLSSTASVNTVKSASPQEETPPSLPPRHSPTRTQKPPVPSLASPEASDLTPLKIVSNSPFKNGHISPVKPPVNGFPSPSASPKPYLPSRLNKPTPPAPTKSSPARTLPSLPPPTSRPSPAMPSKAPLPTPPSSPRPRPHRLASLSPSSPRRAPQDLPATERLTGGRKLPVPPPSSPGPAKHRSNGVSNGLPPSPNTGLLQNGHNGHVASNGHDDTNSHVANGYHNGHAKDIYTNSDFDQDDSLEGTSVDEPETKENQALKVAGRMIVFRKAEEVVSHVAQHLRESQVLCLAGQGEDRNEVAFLRAKELLTTEARQFVTASKLFVKSATESEGQLMECLNHCVHMVDRIGTITRDVALSTTTPSQTGGLITKVQDVADTYLQTLQAASRAIGRDMNDPSMNVLMKKATALAGVLTTLMRSLRVFN